MSRGVTCHVTSRITWGHVISGVTCHLNVKSNSLSRVGEASSTQLARVLPRNSLGMLPGVYLVATRVSSPNQTWSKSWKTSLVGEVSDAEEVEGKPSAGERLSNSGWSLSRASKEMLISGVNVMINST